MSTTRLPVTNIPQTFQITLGGIDYVLTCKWNDAVDAGWVLDLANANTGASIFANIPVITGIDILSGLEYLGINGKLYAFTDGNDFAVPTLFNLGVESNIYFVTV